MTVDEERPADEPSPAVDPDEVSLLQDASPGVADTDGHAELLPAKGPFRTVMKTVGLIEQSIGLALIVVILVLVLAQVAQRYIDAFGGWPWTGEVARLALVWCTFVLSGYLMAQDRHITIKIIDLVIRGRALGVVKLMSHLIVLATCLGMAYATYSLIADDIGQLTPAAGIPLAWVYVMPLIGFLLTGLRALMFIGMVDVPEIARGRERGT